MYNEQARLWSNLGRLEIILYFLLLLFSVLELTFQHVRDGLLFIATSRAGVHERLFESILLPHDWKGAMCHFEELEAVRVFQLPID